jgi:endonuclease-3 related protein
MGINAKKALNFIYKRLYESFGPQGWWPADTKLEIIVGAILTQNTAWANVEKAVSNLKKKKILSVKNLKEIHINKLAKLIKPAGYYNVKAKRLKTFIDFLINNYDGSIKKMFKKDYLKLRADLLNINGIGQETADSILLYAGNKPIFVIDAYTKKILSRHHLIDKDAKYSTIQNLFMDNIEKDPKFYNEYHALLVNLGKNICTKIPHCQICPIKDISRVIECVCDSCGARLLRPEERYNLDIQLYASPKTEITKEELLKNTKEELKKLIANLKNKDARKLEEQVYINYRFTLCKRCRDKLQKRLALREFI